MPKSAPVLVIFSTFFLFRPALLEAKASDRERSWKKGLTGRPEGVIGGADGVSSSSSADALTGKGAGATNGKEVARLGGHREGFALPPAIAIEAPETYNVLVPKETFRNGKNGSAPPPEAQASITKLPAPQPKDPNPALAETPASKSEHSVPIVQSLASTLSPEASIAGAHTFIPEASVLMPIAPTPVPDALEPLPQTPISNAPVKILEAHTSASGSIPTLIPISGSIVASTSGALSSSQKDSSQSASFPQPKMNISTLHELPGLSLVSKEATFSDLQTGDSILQATPTSSFQFHRSPVLRSTSGASPSPKAGELILKSNEFSIGGPRINFGAPDIRIQPARVIVGKLKTSVQGPIVNVAGPRVVVADPRVSVGEVKMRFEDVSDSFKLPDIQVPDPMIRFAAPHVTYGIPRINSTSSLSLPAEDIEVPGVRVRIGPTKVSVPAPSIEFQSNEVSIPGARVSIPPAEVLIPAPVVETQAPQVIIVGKAEAPPMRVHLKGPDVGLKPAKANTTPPIVEGLEREIKVPTKGILVAGARLSELEMPGQTELNLPAPAINLTGPEIKTGATSFSSSQPHSLSPSSEISGKGQQIQAPASRIVVPSPQVTVAESLVLVDKAAAPSAQKVRLEGDSSRLSPMKFEGAIDQVEVKLPDIDVSQQAAEIGAASIRVASPVLQSDPAPLTLRQPDVALPLQAVQIRESKAALAPPRIEQASPQVPAFPAIEVPGAKASHSGVGINAAPPVAELPPAEIDTKVANFTLPSQNITTDSSVIEVQAPRSNFASHNITVPGSRLTSNDPLLSISSPAIAVSQPDITLPEATPIGRQKTIELPSPSVVSPSTPQTG